MEMEDFFEGAHLPYAILSHTWGEEEVTFQEWENRSAPVQAKKGYQKIEGLCREAKELGLDWVWVDTCCIDKKSSAELSEAINSMFRWYAQSAICLTYLSDVPPEDHPTAKTSYFRRSRWFSRGWTLQELVAPREVNFYDESWQNIGRRGDLEMWRCIADITGIDEFLIHQLEENDLKRCEMLGKLDSAMWLSWVSKRQTSRKEDMAYCMMGLLGVHMPLLYGEGDRAFIRLQEELIRTRPDQTLLFWGLPSPKKLLNIRSTRGLLLADSPSCFEGYDSSINWMNQVQHHYLLTNLGLQIQVDMVRFSVSIDGWGFGIGLLGYTGFEFNDLIMTQGFRVAIPLVWRQGMIGSARVAPGNSSFRWQYQGTTEKPSTELIYMRSSEFPAPHRLFKFELDWRILYDKGYRHVDHCPPLVVQAEDHPAVTSFQEYYRVGDCVLLQFGHPEEANVLVLIRRGTRTFEQPTPDCLDMGENRVSVGVIEEKVTSWELLSRPSFSQFDSGPLEAQVAFSLKVKLGSINLGLSGLPASPFTRPPYTCCVSLTSG